MSEEQAERGFKVSDRRRFSQEGDARETEETAPTSESAAPGEATPPSADAHATRADATSAAPEVSFTAFVLGLSTQALIALGEVDDPQAGSPSPDLVAAKQLIDIVGMLQAKTKGNLDPSEAALLDHLLYDLRMKYVERARTK